MERLLRVLQSESEDRLTCGQCREQLPAFLLALEQGGGTDAAWADVQSHIELCLACGELYADLLSLAEPDAAAMAAAATSPRPAFSFANRKSLVTIQLRSLTEAVISFGEGIMAEVQRAFTAPSLAPLRSDARSDGGKFEEKIAAPQLENLFDATVTIRRAEDADLCTIVVTVLPPGKGWPHGGGTLVTLSGGPPSHRPQETDPFGVASFSNVAIAELPQLSIVVERLP